MSARLRIERRRLAVTEWWVAFRCDRLHRCPGCNVCEPAQIDGSGAER